MNDQRHNPGPHIKQFLELGHVATDPGTNIHTGISIFPSENGDTTYFDSVRFSDAYQLLFQASNLASNSWTSPGADSSILL